MQDHSTSSHQPPAPDSVISSESAAEMARLLNKARLQTHHMGGLLPDQPDPTVFRDVLDIGCGPGAWVFDLAFEYPDMWLVGIDNSELSIRYGNLVAREQGLHNVTFRQMDFLQPLHFPDASFDLINAKFIVEFMPRDGWMRLLKECWRLLRTGGIMRLTEFEMGFSNSPAHEYMCGLFLRTLQLRDHLFSPDGRHLGIINMLQPLLRRAGFHSPDEKYRRLYGVDYSFGTELHEEWCRDLLVHAQLILPFIARAGLATREELQRGMQRMEEEMYTRNFAALWTYLTAFGVKQEQPDQPQSERSPA